MTEQTAINENDRFRAYCEKMGFRIDSYDNYQEKYGIDFIISRVNGIHATVSLAVRFTRTEADLAGQERLIQSIEQGIATKALYVEAFADADTGLFPLVHAACIVVMFDMGYSEWKTVGLRVHEDKVLRFFNLVRNVQSLRIPRPVSKSNGTHGSNVLCGDIVAYVVDRGFGFIEDEAEQKFFFHIANVEDVELEESLTEFKEGEKIPVKFQNGGVGAGKKFPKAISVVEDFEEDVLEAS